MSSCFCRMIVAESCLNKGETAVAQCSYTAVMASNMIISPCETLSIRSGWGSKANPWIAGVLYRGMITGTHWTSIFDRHDSRGVHWRWGHARLSTHLAGTWKGAIWNYLRKFLSTSSSKWLISFREISPNCFKKSRPPMELAKITISEATEIIFAGVDWGGWWEIGLRSFKGGRDFACEFGRSQGRRKKSHRSTPSWSCNRTQVHLPKDSKESMDDFLEAFTLSKLSSLMKFG